MTPEEKLLRAIFGEKASDVRDTSLRLPPGDYGTVVEVRVFNRHGVDKDERALQIEREMVEGLSRDRDDELAILERNIYARLKDLILGKTAVKGPKGIKAGSTIDEELLGTLSRGQWWQLALGEEPDAPGAGAAARPVRPAEEGARPPLRGQGREGPPRRRPAAGGDEDGQGLHRGEAQAPARRQDGRPPRQQGRRLQVVPEEDMPFLADGTPVDFVLNPLGVPSRMNVGQILETHMGWAARGLGRAIDAGLQEYRHTGDMTPLKEAMKVAYGEDVYNEAIAELPQEEFLEVGGQRHRRRADRDPGVRRRQGGRRQRRARSAPASTPRASRSCTTAAPASSSTRPVTVGVKYLLKLHHLVDDKIHARSTGPYSLVTQQPLGGKAQFGGQRFGEMEVWALEAYGAAYTLQEMLTVKSDDVAGRTKVYELIVKGEDNFEAGVPELFNVLVKEIRSLGLNIELLDSEAE